DQIPLTSAFDSNGPGETFESTGADRTVALTYEPYIDYDKIEQEGSYTANGFQGVYQPITIILSDGTVAINMTNYLTGLHNTQDPDSSLTTYIHSGKNIIFNKPIDSRFTVYYQYSPSNLRFRV